ncbi:hypothetical protein ABPG74_003125 [Tetrahymena malaccensis]
MSSKLQDKKDLKEPSADQEKPCLYQMLQNEATRAQRERKLEQNMKILNQKYLEMFQASRSLFSISVKLLTYYMEASPHNVDRYKRRQYILDRDTQNVLVKLIIKTMKGQEKGSVTQRFCLAVLHKITLHDELMSLFLEEKLHLWLVDLLKMSISSENQKDIKLHVFVLEYASATLANLLSAGQIMSTFYGQQQSQVQFLDSLLKCLDFQNSVQANKFIIKSLSYFTKGKFNQAILETIYDEKINQFLDQVSRKTDEDYKTQVLAYHAIIFTAEVNKQILDMDQKDEYESGMRKKYDENDDSIDYGYDDPDSVIIFEHFNDELTDKLLNGVYNR